jgi:hypothetical protein
MSKLINWKTHLESWKNSGLSQAEYCKRNNLKPVTFSYWKCRQKNEANQSSGFVAVNIPKTIAKSKYNASDSFRIDLPDGMKLTFSIQTAPERIAKIISVLRRV